MNRLLATLLIALLAPTLAVAQEPSEPVEPPAEEADDSVPQEETAAEVEPDVPLTPEEEERRRLLAEAAAERAAKREERRLKRETKKLAEEAKRAEKNTRQNLKLAEQITTLMLEGHGLLEEGKFAGARQRFRKANELGNGYSWEANMGLARTELASENFSLAVRDAQRAFASTGLASRQAEALTLAGTVTLAAAAGSPQALPPGAEMYSNAALRFFMRAATIAPIHSPEAVAHVERHFPSRDISPKAARLLERYLNGGEEAEAAQARRVLMAYEAQLSGPPPGDEAVAVVGAILPPVRTGGSRVEFSAEDGEKVRRRSFVSLEVGIEGEVRNVTVLNSLNPRQDAAVVEALERWTYEPAQLPGGQPVAVFWLATVSANAS
jgi:hypothetical protein